ncbi:MAG: dephospho-CoA kinase [Pseudomonadota bacterium]
MDWIGITGMMGAGKTTVSRTIQGLGYPVAYADEVARSVLEPGTEGLSEVVSAFGSEVLKEDKTLDREALAKKVFGNRENLLQLEKITHPRIQAKVRDLQEEFKRRGAKLGFYDVPLLFEKNLEARFDTIVCVVADDGLVKERLKKRESWSDEEISSRLSHQLSQSVKEAGSQYVIHNNTDLEGLKVKVQSLINDLLIDPKKNPHRG